MGWQGPSYRRFQRQSGVSGGGEMTRHNGRASAVWGSTGLRGRGAVALGLRRLCGTAAFVWVPWLLRVATTRKCFRQRGRKAEENGKREAGTGKTRRSPGRFCPLSTPLSSPKITVRAVRRIYFCIRLRCKTIV